MNILSVITTTKIASVCVTKGYEWYLNEISNEVTHSEKLLPAIDEALSKQNMTLKDIDLYATINGPGSFTGIRIGLASIKAFAMIDKKNIFSISSNMLIEMTGYLKSDYFKEKKEAYVVSLIDAKNLRVYYSVSKIKLNENNKLEVSNVLNIDNEDIDDALLKVSKLLKNNENVIFCGDCINTYSSKISNISNTLIDYYPNSKDLIDAYNFLDNTKDYLFDTYTLDANYVRPSQAERMLENGNKKA